MPCIFNLKHDDGRNMWDATLERMDHKYLIGGSGYTPKEAIDHVMESYLLAPGKSLRNDRCKE